MSSASGRRRSTRSTGDAMAKSAQPGPTVFDVIVRRVSDSVGNPAVPSVISAEISAAGISPEPVSGRSHSTAAAMPPWCAISALTKMRAAPGVVGRRPGERERLTVPHGQV